MQLCDCMYEQVRGIESAAARHCVCSSAALAVFALVTHWLAGAGRVYMTSLLMPLLLLMVVAMMVMMMMTPGRQSTHAICTVSCTHLAGFSFRQPCAYQLEHFPQLPDGVWMSHLLVRAGVAYCCGI